MRVAKLSLSLLVLVLLALAAAPAARCDTPVNGDFSHSGDHWVSSGDCSIVTGSATCGQFSPTCFGSEASGFVGTIKTDKSYELKPGWRIKYDYTIVTSDIVVFDNERIVLVNEDTGAPTTLDVFNPNPTLFTCGTFTGTRSVTIPSSVDQGHYFIELLTVEDGFGDLFGIHISNVDVDHFTP